ncbi:hypothetical protein BV20DRAFT_971615 [Pilatotrama ljubarskyi]|nr:hypothetical protein BV20DRAFT_971615 [Pilatotrama ljubarskyi]
MARRGLWLAPRSTSAAWRATLALTSISCVPGGEDGGTVAVARLSSARGLTYVRDVQEGLRQRYKAICPGITTHGSARCSLSSLQAASKEAPRLQYLYLPSYA